MTYFYKKLNPYINLKSTYKVDDVHIKEMAGVVGFEPTHRWVRAICLTTWLHPNIRLTNYNILFIKILVFFYVLCDLIKFSLFHF